MSTQSNSVNTAHDLDARFELITRGVDVTDLELIRQVLKEKEKPSLFWGVAPTGRPHIGYIVPFVKIAEFVEAGVDVTVLLADIYAFLVNYKYSREVVAQRTEYYRLCLSALFEGILGLPVSTIKFQQQSSFALSERYILDIYQFLTLTAQDDVRAPNDELKNAKMLSPLLCPIMQALDEQHTNSDFELGGMDQAGLFAFGKKFMSKLGYTRKVAHMMNPMLPGLRGTKMSASDPRSKIDLLDAPNVVEQKITDAVCEASMLEDNPILALLRIVLIPISKLRLVRQTRGGGKAPFVEKDAPDGTVYSVKVGAGVGFRHYKSYEEIEADFSQGKVMPEALKAAVAKGINQLLEPIRNSFSQNPAWKVILDSAYPESEEEVSTASSTADASDNFCYPGAVREISNDCLKLIPFNSSKHAAEFIRLAKQSPEIWAHMPLGPYYSVQSFVTEFIESFVRPNTGMLLYTVIDKTRPGSVIDKDGALAGLIAYINTSTLNQSTEIGFVITLPPFQRTHVTSNAIGLLLNFAFTRPGENGLGLRRVQWQTSSANQASIRTAERIGFIKEGVLRWDRVFPQGKTKGKQDNGKSLRFEYEGQTGHFDEDDIGRDTVMFSMCWDDWFLEGKRDHVFSRMAKK